MRRRWEGGVEAQDPVARRHRALGDVTDGVQAAAGGADAAAMSTTHQGLLRSGQSRQLDASFGSSNAGRPWSKRSLGSYPRPPGVEGPMPKVLRSFEATDGE